MRKIMSVTICVVFLQLLLIANHVQAKPKPGDLLVVDQAGGTAGFGALILVKPGTGRRTVLSDFGDAAQGSLGAVPASVAVGAGGRIFVSDLFAGEPPPGGGLFEVDPETGNRTLVSNFGQGDPQGLMYYGLAVDTDGGIVANTTRGDSGPVLVVRVRPETDERALITDLADPVQGETEPDRFITELTLERSRRILIGTARGSGQVDAAIFRVNSVNGRRRLLSDFANAAQGADLADLSLSKGLAVEASGRILAASSGVGGGPGSLLLRIHPRTGQRTVVSDFANPAQGATGDVLSGVAVKRSGKIIVGASGSLFKVRPRSGRRALFSDSGNAEQGPPFQAITSIAVVPRR